MQKNIYVSMSSGYVHPYITRQLAELRTQKRTAEEGRPNAVFDVDASTPRAIFTSCVI